MLLWNIIRNWFVQYVWGGHYVTGGAGTWVVSKTGLLVGGTGNSGGAIDDIGITTNDLIVFGDNVTLGDWLSTMSTIIVLVAVCFGLYCLTRYFFRMFAGLLSGR